MRYLWESLFAQAKETGRFGKAGRSGEKILRIEQSEGRESIQGFGLRL